MNSTIQSVSMNTAMTKFMESLKTKNMRKETVRGYNIDLTQLHDFLKKTSNGPVLVDEITASHLEQFVRSFQDRQCHGATINRKIYVASSFFKFAVRKRWITYNPTEEVEKVKVIHKERTFLLKEEVNAIINQIKHPVAEHIAIMMSNTGLRVKECTQLQMEHVDLENKVVHVINGKGGKNRDIPMNDDLVRIMKNYLANTRPKIQSLYFFCLKKTGCFSPSYFNELLKKATKEAGIKKDVTSHVLRHSFASRLVKTDAHVAVIQRLLGHADVRTTSIYMHTDSRDLQDAVNNINFL
ncbi:tyrosine-type recombinase/integrase [Viridibacillus arvi]|uniref:tyrosine-type recombinase/integrase n=1 Tax=Viridibacillus arvi TaxID=263475 RepID=UPI00187B96ED|nr:tyrosine-type recombinase/integrase [Viridibacillus sp. JNUCC-6]QOV10429.1 tyrosine-type recombinase/integrase [Viridibacillus sp. JNUCC-6]